VSARSRTVSYASQREDAPRAAATVGREGFAARLRAAGFAVSSEVRFGDPGAVALDTAQAWGAEAIALVDAPARGARRWLTRNVADNIIQKSTIPVLVGRTSGQRSA